MTKGNKICYYYYSNVYKELRLYKTHKKLIYLKLYSPLYTYT